MDRNLTLLTDLYQLTMMNGYFLEGKKDQRVIFDVFFRQNELITYSVLLFTSKKSHFISKCDFI